MKIFTPAGYRYYRMLTMDTHWLEQCRAGEARAVERLVCAYQQELYRLGLFILNDPDEAEEAVQETFLAALRSLDSFREDSSFKTWLYGVAINTCRKRYRRKAIYQRFQTVLQGIFHTQPVIHPEETAIQNETDSRLWQAIQSLDEKQRYPVVLRYYHDLPVAEIAAILQVPQGTIHSRLNLAREKLRAILKEELP